MLDTQVVLLWKFPRVHNIWDWSKQTGLHSIIYIHYGYWKTRTFAKFWSNRFPFHCTCHWNYLNISVGFRCDNSSFIKIIRHKFSVIWIFHLLLDVWTKILRIRKMFTNHGIHILMQNIDFGQHNGLFICKMSIYHHICCQEFLRNPLRFSSCAKNSIIHQIVR